MVALVSACPIRQLAPAWLPSPRVPLLDDEPLRVESKQRDAGHGLHRAVRPRDDAPPVDGSAIARNERFPEAALGLSLLREDGLDVLARALPLAERMRVEDGAGRVERRDRLPVGRWPGSRPD